MNQFIEDGEKKAFCDGGRSKGRVIVMNRFSRATLGLSLVISALPAFEAPARALSAQSNVAAEPLTGVLERIRQDIGYYEVQAARWRHEISAPASETGTKSTISTTAPMCDVKDLDFDVTNVQLTLQTVTGNAATGNVGLRVPFLGKETEVTGDVELHVDHMQTVALTRRFSYSTEQLSRYQDTEDYQRLEAAHTKFQTSEQKLPANATLPVSDALIDLHRNLLRSAEKLPCFERAGNDVKPESSSITIEFQVQQAADADVGFNFLIISAKAGAKTEHTNANTLVVSFAPHVPIKTTVPADRRKAAMKKPQETSVGKTAQSGSADERGTGGRARL
jgi:hypothetical protein